MPFSGFAVHGDEFVVVPHDPEGRYQPQAGAAGFFLGGEKRVVSRDTSTFAICRAVISF